MILGILVIIRRGLVGREARVDRLTGGELDLFGQGRKAWRYSSQAGRNSPTFGNTVMKFCI